MSVPASWSKRDIWISQMEDETEMHIDQLTRAERIRLESLSQSIIMTAQTSQQRPTLADIFGNAERIETWLRQAREDA